MKVTFDELSKADPAQGITSRQIFPTVTAPDGTVSYAPPLEAISGKAECDVPDGSVVAADMVDINAKGASVPSAVVVARQALPGAVPSRPTIGRVTVA